MQSLVQFLHPGGSKKLLVLFHGNLGDLVWILMIVTTGVMPCASFLKLCPTMSVPNGPTIVSGYSFCRSVSRFAGALSAISDATSSQAAETGTSAVGNGCHGEHDWSNCRQNSSSARRLWTAQFLRWESLYSCYLIAYKYFILNVSGYCEVLMPFFSACQHGNAGSDKLKKSCTKYK